MPGKSMPLRFVRPRKEMAALGQITAQAVGDRVSFRLSADIGVCLPNGS